MAKPVAFSFSIKNGDPVRLATAMRDMVAALEPLTDEEAADVVAELGRMYARAKPKQRPPPTTVSGPGVRRG